MKQLYLPLLINFLFIQHGRGKGTMSIKLIHFNNPGGEDNNGNYCDRSVLKWQSACDHYFYLCLDKVNGSKTNIKQCDVATRQTKTVDDKNQIDFTDSIGGTPNPIEIPINKWEGGLLLKVKVWDEDPGLDDSVELLSTIVRMNASKSKEEIIWHPYQLKRRTQLDLEIAVFCDDDSYPPHCTHCKASNDNNGHYYCDSEGGKHCQPGWAGKDCKINKDECESQPCQSGGTCLDQIGEYTCTCKPGYTGIHCETEILSRTATTPQNNTTGINNEGQHSDCPSGYGGSDCETKESTETNVQPTGMYPVQTTDKGKLGKGTSKLFAIIPVILLVVVIAVLVIIWKRRQQRLKEESDPPTERRSDQNGTELYNMAAPVNQGAVGANDQLTDEVTYDEINDCNRQTADDYAVEIYDNSVYGGNQQATYATPQIDDNAVEIYDNSVYGTNQQATYSTPQTDDNAVEMYDNSVYGANQQATYSVPQKDNHKGATARDRSDSVTSEVLIQENEIYN